MFGLDNPSGINVMPAITPKNNSAPLWFTEGGAGLSASYPGQEWFNQVQAELLNVLKEAGVTPDKGRLNQVAAAIRKIIQNTVPNASFTTPGIVKLSSIINSDSDTTAPTSRVVNDVYRM
ncbi:tail fiber protein, partial [Xenorhabdus cabanillasii]|uniref:tail fiber protein n=1 Tax=Xenorhabdus cabanillasii TaxID=351673 RepID=UPI00159BDBED